jgi:hypothetical protein
MNAVFETVVPHLHLLLVGRAKVSRLSLLVPRLLRAETQVILVCVSELEACRWAAGGCRVARGVGAAALLEQRYHFQSFTCNNCHFPVSRYHETIRW